jgi:hypothetical protein
MAPISNEGEALAAARASAIAILVGAAYGVVNLVVGMDAVRAGVEAQMAANPQPGMTSDLLVNVALGRGGLFSLVQLVLGWVQWARPGVIIPIIFSILVAWGLIQIPFSMQAAVSQGVDAPQALIWTTAAAAAVLVVQMLLHIAGIRGARALDRLRMEAARA